MDPFEEMQTFIRVVDAGGISRAADQLDIAKSAVSRRLSDLETRLGVQLITRTTRKLSITDTGKAYYPQCLRLLNDLQEVESSVSSEHQRLSGKLRIAIPLSFGLAHLESVITDFIAEHPEVVFDLDLNDRKVDLVEENFDLAIRIADLKDSLLIARRLFKLHLIAVASPDYLEKFGTPQTTTDLESHTMIGYSLGPAEGLYYKTADGEEGHLKANIAHTCSNGDFLRDLVIAGLGYAVTPTFACYQQIEQGKLVPFMRDYSWSKANAYAVYPPTRHLSHRVRAFIDFLVARFQGIPYWDQGLVPPQA